MKVETLTLSETFKEFEPVLKEMLCIQIKKKKTIFMNLLKMDVVQKDIKKFMKIKKI